MRTKLILFIVVIYIITIITGCEYYTDNNTYYADISIVNCTAQKVSASFFINKSDTRNEYQVFNGAKISELEPASEKKCTLSWIPGEFSVITINGATDKDAHLFVTYEIKSINNSMKNSSTLTLELINNNAKEIQIYEACVKKEYSAEEYNNLMNLLDDEEQLLFNEFYYTRTYDDFSSSFDIWSLEYDNNKNVENLQKFDFINEKYNLKIPKTFLFKQKNR